MGHFAKAVVLIIAVMLLILGTRGALASEPASMLSCGTGLLGIGFVMRKRLSGRKEPEPERSAPESLPAAPVLVTDRPSQHHQQTTALSAERFAPAARRAPAETSLTL